MFRIGEKIVFVGSHIKPRMSGFNYPRKGEIVTVHSYCSEIKGNLDISEYLKDHNGRYQSFNPINFRKLDNRWVDEFLSRITEEVEEVEAQLIVHV